MPESFPLNLLINSDLKRFVPSRQQMESKYLLPPGPRMLACITCSLSALPYTGLLSVCPHTTGPVCGMLLAFHTVDFFITFPNYPMETSSPLPVPHFQHWAASTRVSDSLLSFKCKPCEIECCLLRSLPGLSVWYLLCPSQRSDSR